MMKKLLLTLSIVCLLATYAYSEDLPVFLVETNAGYSVGINLDNAMQINVKLAYPSKIFGITLEVGSFITTPAAFHFYIAPTYNFVNNEKWRIPLAIGFDVYTGEITSYGIGSILSAHYRLTKYFYAGVNLGLTYIFNRVYDEFVGYQTKNVVYNEGTFTQTVPVYESVNHHGNYFYFRPSLIVGLQF